MTSRYLPYATTPARLVAQLISDLVVIAWTTVWVLVGMAVHSAVSTIAEFGRQVEGGANGIAGNLDSAGNGADKVPLIGDALSKPLTAAGQAARDIAGAGHNLDVTASWLAWLLALAVAAPPILAIAMPWLFLGSAETRLSSPPPRSCAGPPEDRRFSPPAARTGWRCAIARAPLR